MTTALDRRSLTAAAGEPRALAGQQETSTVRGVIIRDGAEPGGSGGLDFDLAEVVAALGHRVVTSRWRCSRLHYTSRDEREVPVLEQAAVDGGWVAGSDLAGGIGQLLQVINGEFEVFAENEAPWAVVRAVDSSWWEVWSEDESVLQAVRMKFRMTEDVSKNAG